MFSSLQARQCAAEGGAPVDGADGHRLRKAGQEHGDAGLISALAGGAQHAADYNVAHCLRRDM